IVALEVFLGDVADILVEHLRQGAHAVVQPADAMESGVASRHLMSAIHQVRPKNRADVTVDACYKYFSHESNAPCVLCSSPVACGLLTGPVNGGLSTNDTQHATS